MSPQIHFDVVEVDKQLEDIDHTPYWLQRFVKQQLGNKIDGKYPSAYCCSYLQLLAEIFFKFWVH